MEKETHDKIQKIFIDAILKAQKKVEKEFNTKVRCDFSWEAVTSPSIISDDVYQAM